MRWTSLKPTYIPRLSRFGLSWRLKPSCVTNSEKKKKKELTKPFVDQAVSHVKKTQYFFTISFLSI